jgi:hypothetical protein
MVKRILEDPHCIGLGALWGYLGSSDENSSENIVKKCQNGEKDP